MPRQPPRKREDVDAELAALETLPAERAGRVEVLRQALAARHYRIVAKAARLVEDNLLFELAAALVSAYARFLVTPVKTDPNCIAKKAITRALVGLDHDDVGFYRAGLEYRQFEPVWGGSRDTAPEIRSHCAIGLVRSGHPRALIEIVGLLGDAEADARIGVVRAIACGLPAEAELLLRAKVIAGDPEPNVIGECFTGLLSVEPDESVPFVAAYLEDPDEAIAELAALALGESRHETALEPLTAAWSQVLVGDSFRRALIRAIAAHRSDTARDWLLTQVADARTPVALEIIEALGLFRHDHKLAQRLQATLATRAEPELQQRFAELWP